MDFARNELLPMTEDECRYFKDILLGNSKERDIRNAIAILYNKLMASYGYSEYFLPLRLHEIFVSHRLVSPKMINDVVNVVLTSKKIGPIHTLRFLEKTCSNIKDKLNAENMSVLRKYLDEQCSSFILEISSDAFDVLCKYFKLTSTTSYLEHLNYLKVLLKGLPSEFEFYSFGGHLEP